MDFNTWLHKVIETQNLCNEYKDKALHATSKVQLMRLAMDANGASYLCEMQAKGIPLSYDVIINKFGSYINGRYIAEFKNERSNGYTSSIYCHFSDPNRIDVQTTLCTLLACKSDVYIGDNDFVRLYVDSNCELSIHCPISSRCIVEYWGDAKIVDCLDGGRIDFVKH